MKFNNMDDLFVCVDWLNSNLDRPGVRVVDGSWNMPQDPKAIIGYQQAHIPGAVFFDIDKIAATIGDLPHMIPTPTQFSTAMEQLGIRPQDHVVIYDQKGLFSAARVWWTFKALSHERVSILSGGLPAWIANNHTTSINIPVPTSTFYPVPKTRLLLADQNEIKMSIRTKNSTIIDARPKNRFEGHIDEPRPGLRKGCMPTAINLPYQDVLADGQLKPKDLLKKIFLENGIVGETPIITTCGSGVSAAIILLALHHIGHTNVKLYDGSWAEWGAVTNDPNTFPVVTRDA